jgi:hypothetical protein
LLIGTVKGQDETRPERDTEAELSRIALALLPHTFPDKHAHAGKRGI